MNKEQVAEHYAGLVGDWLCMEAYIGRDGALYYRWDAADPVTDPGQITYNKIAQVGADPVQVGTVEFHEAQKGDKLK